MSNPSALKLSVANDLNYLSPVMALVHELAVNSGFGREEINKIELAVEEAVTNIIRHSLPRNELAYFDIEIQPLTIGMEICIHDMGRPFDEKAIESYDPEKLTGELEPKGLGSFLIRNMMDKVEYQALGNKGKLLRMVKYFENPPVNYDVTKSNPWAYHDEPGPPATDLEFTIRRFVPGDAEALSELAYDTYGYSYVYENVYYPDRLIALNQANEIISVVAIAENGILAGHAGLFCNPAYPGIAEIAMAMVKPQYRGYHLLDRMAGLCVAIALELGITGLFSQALTVHKRSQPSLKKEGLLPIALLIGYFSGGEMKGIEDLSTDRISPLVVFKLMVPYHAGTLYLPERHKGFISSLLSRVSVAWDVEEVIDTGKSESVYYRQVNEFSNYARMFVYEIGKDIVQTLKHYLFMLRKEELRIGELMLNLQDPLTALFFDEIEALGFIFTGILPATTRGNFIALVYINNINANFDNIQLMDDYGQDLLEYIRKEYEERFL